MSTNPQLLQDAYTACIAEALRQGPLIIERWCGEVCDGLNQRGTQTLQRAEQRRLNAAVSALRSHQLEISNLFVKHLSKAIVEQTQPSTQASQASEKTEPDALAGSTSFDELSLLGDDELQDAVVTARLIEAVAMICEPGLAAFSARLSAAQGFTHVKVDCNPLRPKIFSDALLKAVQSARVDVGIRPLWLLFGGTAMGRLVQGLYLRLTELLTRQGVVPAAYRVITQRESSAGLSSVNQTNGVSPSNFNDNSDFGASAFGHSAFPFSAFSASTFAALQGDAGALPTISFPEQQAEATPPQVGAPSRVQSTVNRLRRLFGNANEASASASLPFDLEPVEHQDFCYTLPEALSALDELQAHQDQPQSASNKAVVITSSLVVELRARLKARANSLGQSLALDVVTLMIEKITGDSRLLVSVREVIATFEPAYLRLALKDPRFFRLQSHSARRLLEMITTKSLAYSSVTSPGFTEFMQDLLSTAALLAEKKAPDAQYFADVLARFDKKAKQRVLDARGEHSATAQALVEAEQSILIAKKVAGEIAARSDFVGTNSIVAAFLLGPWSQVMAKERLTVQADKSGMHKAIFSLTLGELLWSLNSEKTALNLKRLTKLIPRILEKVQGGLLSIDLPLADSKAFFNEMLAIHQSALASGGNAAAATEKQGKSAPGRHRKNDIDSLFSNHSFPAGSSSLWSTDTEQHARPYQEASTRPQVSFESTRPFFYSDVSADPAQNQQAVVLGSTELHLGAWIDLAENDQWTRAQLTWISQYKTLLIFTSANGRTHSMAGPLLEFLLLQDQARVISSEGVLAGAIESITRSAMRNKAGTSQLAGLVSRH